MATIVTRLTVDEAYEYCKRGGTTAPFSYAGIEKIFEILEDNGEQLEQEYVYFDAVAVCCEFTEYESFKEAIKDYTTDVDDIVDIIDNLTPVHEEDTLEKLRAMSFDELMTYAEENFSDEDLAQIIQEHTGYTVYELSVYVCPENGPSGYVTHFLLNTDG